MGEFLILLLVGIVVGLLARLFMPGRDPIGFLGTVVVGVVGVFLGYYVSAALPGDNEGVPWIASILVAMVLLWLYRRFATGRRTYT